MQEIVNVTTPKILEQQNKLIPMRITPTVVNLERHLKWEKKKVEKAMNEIIFENTELLVNTLVDIAIHERNPNAINSLLDRGFGRARQNIGLDGGANDKPIVFLPAELMAKYSIKEGTTNVYTPNEIP